MTDKSILPFAHFKASVEEFNNYGTGGDFDTNATGDTNEIFYVRDFGDYDTARITAVNWAISEKMHRDGTFAKVVYFEDQNSVGELVWDSEHAE